jgi:hypothetical protein
MIALSFCSGGGGAEQTCIVWLEQRARGCLLVANHVGSIICIVLNFKQKASGLI